MDKRPVGRGISPWAIPPHALRERVLLQCQVQSESWLFLNRSGVIAAISSKITVRDSWTGKPPDGRPGASFTLGRARKSRTVI
jgi:hypothetical protein